MPDRARSDGLSEVELSERALPETAPDFVEQDTPEELDNIVPSRGNQMLPLVGLGGSAGSIGALQRFFGNVPPDPGMAFAVVLHAGAERGQHRRDESQ